METEGETYKIEIKKEKDDDENIEVHFEQVLKSKTSKPVRGQRNEQRCEICNKVFFDQSTLKCHMRVHSGEKPYKCQACGKEFRQSGHLRNHMQTHTKEKPFQCSVCSKTFALSGQLVTHMKLHSRDKPYVCEVCQEAFARPKHLGKHKRIHQEKKTYTCKVCQLVFTDYRECRKHEATHKNTIRFSCDICEKTFKTRTYLRTHLETHTADHPFKCDGCDKFFRRMGHLRRHYDRVHVNDRSLVCGVCSHTFFSMTDLTRHLRVHTGEKPFVCKVCDKSFATHNMHANHMRTHTGERPYKCGFCTNAFKQSAHLKRHVRRAHTHIKECPCLKCGVLFYEPRDVKRHQKSHPNCDLEAIEGTSMDTERLDSDASNPGIPVDGEEYSGLYADIAGGEEGGIPTDESDTMADDSGMYVYPSDADAMMGDEEEGLSAVASRDPGNESGMMVTPERADETKDEDTISEAIESATMANPREKRAASLDEGESWSGNSASPDQHTKSSKNLNHRVEMRNQTSDLPDGEETEPDGLVDPGQRTADATMEDESDYNRSRTLSESSDQRADNSEEAGGSQPGSGVPGDDCSLEQDEEDLTDEEDEDDPQEDLPEQDKDNC